MSGPSLLCGEWIVQTGGNKKGRAANAASTERN